MASRGVNKVIIVGNLGNDPDVKYANGGGNPVTRISVATSEQWTDKNTQQKQERTEWHRIVFFGRLAEIAGEYLRKGSKVYIEGSLRTNKYTDQAGIEKYSTDIIANEMQMLDSRGDNTNTINTGAGQAMNQNQGGGYAQNTQPQNPAAGMQQSQVQQPQKQQQPAQNTQMPNNDFDDDVPF